MLFILLWLSRPGTMSDSGIHEKALIESHGMDYRDRADSESLENI